MSIVSIIIYLFLSVSSSLILAYFIFLWIGKGFNWYYVFYGMGFFFLGIGLHSLIALPVAVWAQGFRIFIPVKQPLSLDFEIWQLVYFAVAAGVGQEIVKGLPIWLELKRTSHTFPEPPFGWLGLNIGLGFSLSEIFFIGISSWQPLITGFSISDVLIGSWERVSASLFHISTAVWIAYGIQKKKTYPILLYCILLHALVDTIAGLLSIGRIHTSSVIGELSLFLFSFFFLLIIAKKVLMPGYRTSVE